MAPETDTGRAARDYRSLASRRAEQNIVRRYGTARYSIYAKLVALARLEALVQDGESCAQAGRRKLTSIAMTFTASAFLKIAHSTLESKTRPQR